MCSKKMNALPLMVLLMAALFIGCQIEPSGPGGGDGKDNKGGGEELIDLTGDANITFVNRSDCKIYVVEYYSDGKFVNSYGLLGPINIHNDYSLTIPKGIYDFKFYDTFDTKAAEPVSYINGVKLTGPKTVDIPLIKRYPTDLIGDIVTLTFINKTGYTLNTIYWTRLDKAGSKEERWPLYPLVAPGGTFTFPFVKGLYDIEFTDENSFIIQTMGELKSFSAENNSQRVDVHYILSSGK